MKTLKKIIVVFSIIFIVCACKQEPPKPSYTILSGKLENSNGGELTIQSRLTGFKKVSNIKDDGTFIDTLKIEDGYYTILFGKSSSGIFLTKGSSVSFKADEQDFTSSLKFDNDYSDLNNYYAERTRVESKFRFGTKEYCEKEEAEFIDLIVAEKTLLEEKLNTISQIPEEIKEREKRHLYYNYLQNKYMYQAFYHGRFSEKENYVASEGFMKELNEIHTDRPDDYTYSFAYYYLINFAMVGPKALEEYEKDISGGYLNATNKVVISILDNTALKDLVIYDNVEMRLPTSKDKKKVHDYFMEISSNEDHKKRITELYNHVSKLESGKPSPKFNNYENYAGGTTSLKDLKGKYVYIDVWATWCGPCKYEIPFLEKIEKQYHDKNIEFVSISVDNNKDHDKWKQMITDKQMSGMQLFADKAFNSEFIQEYKINGIPQFILLDPQGNIVQSDAPRPSDEKLIELFNQHGI